jgi:hypothetical protein
MWLAVAASFLSLMFMESSRGPAFRGLLYAVPLAGFLATVCGIVGLVRARRTGMGRAQAWLGLSLGTCILVVVGLVGLYVWAIARGWDNSVHF